jgi:hypothetical protein
MIREFSQGITILETPVIHILFISRRSDRCTTLWLKYRSLRSLKLKDAPTSKAALIFEGTRSLITGTNLLLGFLYTSPGQISEE